MPDNTPDLMLLFGSGTLLLALTWLARGPQRQPRRPRPIAEPQD